MNYCKYCGAQIAPDAFVCPHCGRQVGEVSESSIWGILAIVFGALGGWFGLLFGIIGLATYKNESNRKKCKIGIGLFIGWIVFYVIIMIIAFSSLAMVI